MATSAPPRNLTGWVICALIFLLLITTQVSATYLAADPKNPDPTAQSEHLEQYVRAEITAKETPQYADIIMSKAKVTPAQTAAAIKATSTDNPASALVYAEALTELKQPVPAAVAAAIGKAHMPKVKQLSQIYSANPPSPAELKALVNGKPEGTFLIKFAEVQALEMAGDKKIRSETFGSKFEKPGMQQVLILGALFIVPLLLCAGLLFYYNDARNRGLLQPEGHPLEPQTDEDTDRLAMRGAQHLCLFLLASFTHEIPWEKVVPRSLLGALDALIPAIVLVGGSLLLTLVPVMGKKITLADYGLTREKLKASFLWGLGGFFGGIPVVMAVGFIFLILTSRFFPTAANSIIHLLDNPQDTVTVAVATFLATVSAPIFEEIFFRGTLLPALSGLLRGHKWRFPIAIGLAALLFAAGHSSGVPTWGIIGGIGVLNGLLCYQTKSVGPGMLVHMLYNGTLIAIALVIQS